MQCNIDIGRKTGICDDTEDCETSMTLRGEGLRTNTSGAGSKPLFVFQREVNFLYGVKNLQEAIFKYFIATLHSPVNSSREGERFSSVELSVRQNDCHLSSLWFALGSVAQPTTTNGDYVEGHTDLYMKIEPSGPGSRLKNSSVSEMLAK
ncbi:hypothetical protein M404DRAFT_556036 [Pisolithus tinctorius Marx 270]|uniref:Uncharacterized protein n=1 Tax=Pisolithus tinctorius Marx 270 TaxID=870435 RepID=A0A0C3J539_PISTI|nr:hypothetical protein M404DRAFT_556036 [Pisolithus tinctorius Marx 270]